MSDDPTPTFSGSIVLKAKTQAEVKALAAQLAWYAVFEDPFHNRYEGGYAAKGQVRTVPLEATPDDALLETQILDQAAQIGQLQERIAELERDHASAKEQAAYAQKWLDLLAPDEHWRLVGRNLGMEKGAIVVEPAVGDQMLQALAGAILERVARRIELEAPDNPHCNQRAADVCAALVRSLIPGPQATSVEEAARQAERAAAIMRRFLETFGGGT